MPSVFSTLAHAISQELNSKGIDFPRSHVFEVIAASLCYSQYKTMLPQIESIQGQLQSHGAMAILQAEKAYQRVLDLLGVTKEDRRKHNPVADEIVKVVLGNFSAAMPHSIFRDEDSFGRDFMLVRVGWSIKNHSHRNVREAQEKVLAATGKLASEFDLDEVEWTELNNKQETQWRGNVLSRLLPTDAQGNAEPYDEKVLLNVEVTFDKVDRCMVAPNFKMRVLGALAVRPNPTGASIHL